MIHPDRCPECGAERSAGICPRCLIRLGIDGAGSSRSSRSFLDDPTGLIDGETPAVGVLETIAASIGPVPRVLLRDTGPGEQPGPIVRPQSPDDDDHSIRYRIDGEIARGGMGAILKGRDPDLGRDVALKVLRDDLRHDADMIRRFIEEAQIGGQLQHPGIAPVYELGTFTDHRPFFSMKLVKGHTLAQWLDARKDFDHDRPRFLSIFEAICQTVAYAHARGVIHRDLKPSNVMVGAFGEVQVMDWGLAKVLPRGGVADDEKAGQPDHRETVIVTARSGSGTAKLSRAGSVMGTPAYMAPSRRAAKSIASTSAPTSSPWARSCVKSSPAPAFLGRSSGEIQRKAALGDTADALARLDACGADFELIAIAKDCLARGGGPPTARRGRGRTGQGVSGGRAGPAPRRRGRGAAESARAEEADRRARAEHRARRFQVGLAASLLVLVLAGGLTFTYLLHQSQERAARFVQIVAETKVLLNKARGEPGEPSLWRDALDALERARGQGPEDQLTVLGGEIRAGLDQAERDVRLRQQLVEIRADQQDVGPDGTDAAYAAAFSDTGLDLEVLGPDEFARRLSRQPRAVAIELAAFLDDWATERDMAHRPKVIWWKPLEAARLVDPDAYRDRLRAIIRSDDRRTKVQVLMTMAAAPEVADLSAPTAVLLGKTLTDLGQAEAAVALLRPATVRYPDDVWVNYYLAGALDKLRPSARGALRYYTAARTLRPETAHELAHLLERMGRGAEAEAIFRDLAKRRPQNARNLACLGTQLVDRGRATDAATILDRAIAAARHLIRLNPDDVGVYLSLGNALRSERKWAEAADTYRQAIRLKPDDARFHFGLGNALLDHGKTSEAIAEYREAIRLYPDDALAHVGLGNALHDQGKWAEAVAAYREAIRLKPDDASAHVGVGNALHNQRKWAEAVTAYQGAAQIAVEISFKLIAVRAMTR